MIGFLLAATLLTQPAPVDEARHKMEVALRLMDAKPGVCYRGLIRLDNTPIRQIPSYERFGTLQKESIIQEILPDGACDSEAECTSACEPVCNGSGYGDEVCYIDITQNENGTTDCTAECNACGSDMSAYCVITCWD